jgi:PAS domain S-box-containing protein
MKHRCSKPLVCQTVMDSVAAGIFTVDLDWNITSFNREAERITGVRREEAIGRHWTDIVRASDAEENCALEHSLRTGDPVINRAVYLIDRNSRRVPISISTAPLRDENNRIVGCVESFQDLTRVEELQKKLEAQYSFEDIIGRSAAMQRVFELLPVVAESESTILIEGASGTGKELVARAIHNLSPRGRKRFVAISCGALPDTLLESELFGYKKGAFTDARRDKPGRFAMAEGGTVFLDEIGDISQAMQARLLRVLQERVYEPLGAVDPIETDVRIVAATNQKLHDLVNEGTFRDDLFYRINVIRVNLPPLCDRREDIPLLADHFLHRFNSIQEKDVAGIAPEAMALLLEHDYPGNVRELENIIEHACVLCRRGLIERAHLPSWIRGPAAPARAREGAMTLKQMERVAISDAIRRHGGNRHAAADELGIHASTLFRKVRALAIELPAQDGRSHPEAGQSVS